MSKRFLAAFSACLCLTSIPLHAESAVPEKRILIVYSFSGNFAPDFQFVDTFNHALAAGDEPLRLKHLELDAFAPQNATPQALDRKLEPALPALRAGEYDIVIPIGQIAIDLIARHGAEISSRTAVVFCGLDVMSDELIKSHPNCTGAFGRVSVTDNIDLGLRFFPKTRKVILLTDWSVQGRRICEDLKRYQTNYPDISFSTPDNERIPLNAMLRMVAEQGQDTLVLFYAWFNSDSTNLASLEYISSRLGKSKTRILALQAPMFWNDAVAGVFTPVDQVGIALATCVDSIFKGRPTSQIPPASIALKTYVNWHFVKNGTIRATLVPPGTELTNQPPRIHAEDVPLVCGLAALCVLALLTIVLLFLAVRRLRRQTSRVAAALDQTRDLENEKDTILGAVFQLSPVGISIKDADNHYKFVDCNRAFAEMVERPIHEILGHDDFELAFSAFNADNCVTQDKAVIRTGKTCNVVEQTNPLSPSNRAFRVIKMPIYMKDNRRYVLGLFIDITQHINLERQQNQLLAEKNELFENEQIVNGCLQNAVIEGDFNRSVRSMLSRIGKRLRADRCDIFSFDADYSHFSCVYSWETNEPSAEVTGPRVYATADFPGWFELINAHQIITVNDFSAIPASQACIAETVRPYNLKAILVCGIWVDQKLIGFVKLDYVRTPHAFTAADKSIIEEACKIYCLARMRYAQMQALAEQNNRESQIFDDINMPMLLLDENRIIRTANHKSFEIFGPELIGRKICDCVCKKIDNLTCNPAKCSFLSLLAAGRHSFMKTIPIQGRSYQMNGESILDLNGKLVCILVTYVDITEFTDALKRSQAADKAKSFFLASVSHEIRTPLNAVLGFAELLKDQSLPQPTRLEYLNAIRTSGDALLKLVMNVLDLSQLEAGSLSLAPEWIDLAGLCGNVQTAFSPAAKQKNLDLRLLLPSPPIPQLYLDGPRLRQVLNNLVGNAVQFTEKGSAIIDLQLRAEPAAAPAAPSLRTVILTVKDTGPGISDEDRRKIFEPFTQLSRMRGSSAGNLGSGLGLAITRRLVERMGGVLELAASDGHGSTFIVRIPNVPARGDDSDGAGGALPAPSGDGGTAGVLVVDDVPMNIKVISSMLRRLGVPCFSASGGQEALAQLRKSPVRKILTDLWMPEMNGQQLAAAVRTDAAYHDVSLIAVTADANPEKSFNLDLFDSVIHKPVTIDKLKTLLAIK